jgi:peroxin-2
MQNLKYRNELFGVHGSPSKIQKLIHATLLIGLPYIHARLNKILTEGDDSQETSWWMGGKTQVDIWRKLNALEMYVKLAQMINFLIFLVNGKYRNLADRIMGMRLVFAKRLMLRQVSFDYMNRELVWNGFAVSILNFICELTSDRKLSFFCSH